jgi:hypothetical protein
MVTAIPIDKEVNRMEWNNLVMLGLEMDPGDPGEMYNKVISAPSVVSVVSLRIQDQTNQTHPTGKDQWKQKK